MENPLAVFRLVHVDTKDIFLRQLEGVTDPERKRKTVGAAFIDTFQEEANRIGGADFLAQGTLYPDVIESASFTGGPSMAIKSHHNVGGLRTIHFPEFGGRLHERASIRPSRFREQAVLKFTLSLQIYPSRKTEGEITTCICISKRKYTPAATVYLSVSIYYCRYKNINICANLLISVDFQMM